MEALEVEMVSIGEWELQGCVILISARLVPSVVISSVSCVQCVVVNGFLQASDVFPNFFVNVLTYYGMWDVKI